MRNALVIFLLALLVLAGCEWGLKLNGSATQPVPAPAPVGSDAFRLDPLPVQQAKAYPETSTGLFVSLADFEDAPGGARGFTQLVDFDVQPATAAGGQCKFVVNITRTGVGALEATLPVGSALVFRIPGVHDFTGYKLLSLAVYSRSLRDDLTVTLATETTTWQSHRTLVSPGWNNVLLDIQHLAQVKGFDITSVRTMRIAFPDAAGPVSINVDDIMLIDNARTIRPTPPQVTLRQSGLDYTLRLPGRAGEIALRQDDDGLWRWGDAQAQLRLAGLGQDLPASGEHLERMGQRRVGAVEMLECNAVRIRLANTWYFPPRAGEWASPAVPQVRWEYTFYGDGRWVTEGTINNAGGAELGSAGVYLPAQAAWVGAGLDDHFVLRDLTGDMGRWQYLSFPAGSAGESMAQAYLRPPRIERAVWRKDAFAPGDAARDGFDESQGCFYLAAKAGQCRFTIIPPAEGVWNPVFVVAGPWVGPVDVGSEGLALRDVVRREDGTVLFVLPGLLRRPTAVEVAGKPAAPAVAPAAGGRE